MVSDLRNRVKNRLWMRNFHILQYGPTLEKPSQNMVLDSRNRLKRTFDLALHLSWYYDLAEIKKV